MFIVSAMSFFYHLRLAHGHGFEKSYQVWDFILCTGKSRNVKCLILDVQGYMLSFLASWTFHWISSVIIYCNDPVLVSAFVVNKT